MRTVREPSRRIGWRRSRPRAGKSARPAGRRNWKVRYSRGVCLSAGFPLQPTNIIPASPPTASSQPSDVKRLLIFRENSICSNSSVFFLRISPRLRARVNLLRLSGFPRLRFGCDFASQCLPKISFMPRLWRGLAQSLAPVCAGGESAQAGAAQQSSVALPVCLARPGCPKHGRRREHRA